MGMNLFIDTVDVRVSYHTIPVLKNGVITHKKNSSYRWVVPIVLQGYTQLVDLPDGTRALIKAGNQGDLTDYEPYNGVQPSSRPQLLSTLVPGTAGRGRYSLCPGNVPGIPDNTMNEPSINVWFEVSDIPVKVVGIYTQLRSPGKPSLIRIKLLGILKDAASTTVLVSYGDLKLFLFPLTNGFKLMPKRNRFYLPFPFRSLSLPCHSKRLPVPGYRSYGTSFAYQGEVVSISSDLLLGCSPWFNRCLGDNFTQVNGYDGTGVEHWVSDGEICFVMPERPVFVAECFNNYTKHALIFPAHPLFAPLFEVISAGFLEYNGDDVHIISLVKILTSIPANAVGEIFSRVLKEPFNRISSMMRWIVPKGDWWHNQGPFTTNATIFTKDVDDTTYTSWLTSDYFRVVTSQGVLKFSWTSLCSNFYITPVAIIACFFEVLFPVANYEKQTNVADHFFNAYRGRLDFSITSKPRSLGRSIVFRDVPHIELTQGFHMLDSLSIEQFPILIAKCSVPEVDGYKFQKYIGDVLSSAQKNFLAVEYPIFGVKGPSTWIFNLVVDEFDERIAQSQIYYQFVVSVDSKNIGVGRVTYATQPSMSAVDLVIPLCVYLGLFIQ